jgi:hypothetical protein
VVNIESVRFGRPLARTAHGLRDDIPDALADAERGNRERY